MSLRVAMVGACAYPVPQGSQVLLRETARAVALQGHEVHLVVYGYGIGEDASGLRLHRCAQIPGARKTAAGPSWAKPALDCALTVTLRRVIREQRIDIVHAHNYEGLAVALAAGKRPVVYHAHNVLRDEAPYYFGGASWAAWAGAWLDRSLPRRATELIALHDRLADYLVTCGCTPERVTVIAPSLDPWDFDTKVTAVPRLVYTGNLDAYQNIGFLRDVLQRVRKQAPGASLTIATASPRPIDGAEVVATPDLESLQDLMREDCIVLCPRVSWSGYPIKLLNAMAAGKPIVACASAAPALVNGETGIVVADGDGAGFADAVVGLMRDADRRIRLGAAAREQLRQFHGPAATGRAIDAVYDRALGAMRDGAHGAEPR